MPKRVTTTDFIERAKTVHGHRYDYTLAEYRGTHEYITIVCREHGPFQQSPANHYHGKGCSDCGGSKPHSTETFITAARAVHGDRYDYSLVVYTRNKAPVSILCADHGPFFQIAAVHLRGNGCPDCGGNKKHNTESFIEKARAVHGDRYNYSKVDYKGSHASVTVICPCHGPFIQSPTNHFAGKGCPACGNIAAGEARRKTTEQFIAKSKAIHGDRYDYSLVEYVGSAAKVAIVCSKHGIFEQAPSEHLFGSGCAKCGVLARGAARTKTTNQFIASSREVHGDRYDYSMVEYLSTKEKVTIICPRHGPFDQLPNGHLGGKGCYECGLVASGDAKRSNTEQFIAKARMVHGDRYDYSQVEYFVNHKKVKIVCPDHGLFLQTPNVHIDNKSGCADCAVTGFNPSKPGLLYYLAIATDDRDICYKIGITNLSIEERFRGTDLARIRVVKIWHFSIGRVAAERESEILYRFAGDRYYGPRLLIGAGNTELFKRDILGLDEERCAHGQSVVDGDASFVSLQIQSEFDF